MIDEILTSQLDDEQLAIATEVEHNVLVLAPPGSGKTRVLVNAAAHRIRHSTTIVGRDNARAMCLTFGTDAAREMKQRFRQKPLSTPAHRLWVGNYHGISALLLRRHGHLIGWPRNTGIAGDNEGLIRETIDSLGIKGLQLRNVSTALSDLKGNRQTEMASDSLNAIRQHYDALLRERNLRDYDDLIAHTCELLDQEPRLRRIIQDAYPFVLVDELQDTNVAQLELLAHLIGKNTIVFGVADDDQMIYGWRDAHPANLDTFVSTFNAEERPLVGNYRCPPKIVSAANRIISQNSGRKKAEMESRITSHDGELIVMSAATISEPSAVVTAIHRCARDGFALGDIAILAPHSFKFDDVTRALDEEFVPYVRTGGQGIASNPVIKILTLCLRHLAGSSIVDSDVESLKSTQSSDELVDTITSAADSASAGTPRGLVNRLLSELDLGTSTHPTHAIDQIKTLAKMARRATDDQQPSTSEELAELVLRDWQRLERAALESANAVKVMTSFAAKGTEYPVVIMPYLNLGVVPYKRSGEEIDWPAARRVFYVALTRTEKRAILIHNANSQRSPLLDAVIPEATEIVTL